MFSYKSKSKSKRKSKSKSMKYSYNYTSNSKNNNDSHIPYIVGGSLLLSYLLYKYGTLEKIPPPPLPKLPPQRIPPPSLPPKIPKVPKVPKIPIVPIVPKVHSLDASDFNKCKNIAGFIPYDDDEIEPRMKNFLDNYGHEIYDVKPDGNCFFHAISTGLLNKRNIYIDSDKLRQEIVSFILDNNDEEMLAYEHNNTVMERFEWENMMRTNGTYADGLVTLYMTYFLKINYGLNLIIYKAHEDHFRKLDGLGDFHYKIVDPATNVDDNLIIIHTGNHYMVVIAPFILGRHFGIPKKSIYRSKKSRRRSKKRR